MGEFLLDLFGSILELFSEDLLVALFRCWRFLLSFALSGAAVGALYHYASPAPWRGVVVTLLLLTGISGGLCWEANT